MTAGRKISKSTFRIIMEKIFENLYVLCGGDIAKIKAIV